MGIALITNNILSDSGTAIAGLVPTSRTISTTAPLTGGGDLSANRTIAIPAATTTVDGYLTAVDWTTFNGKQAAGDYITSLTGEATAVGPGAAAVTLNNASVTGKLLTGVNITGGTVLATDTMLTAFGKLQNQINGLIGSTIYQGVWNANTNTPTLASGVGTNGYYYIVNVAGATNLDGITDWKIGDWAIFNGGVWQKVDNTESVTSVNGFTGAVSLTTDNVGEGTTNLYFSNARARSAISLTVTGASGASTYNNTTGVLNVPTYTLAGLGGQPLATNLTSLAGLTFASTAFVKMTAAGTFALDTTAYGTGTVTSVAALTLGTTGTDLSSSVATGTTTPVITLNVPTASATNRGALSAADWTTFNSKQNALTNPVTGTGTTNKIPKFTGASTLGNSIITEGTGFITVSGAAVDNYVASFINTDGGSAGIYVKADGPAFLCEPLSMVGGITLNSDGSASFSGDITANKFIKSGGTSAQYLMADGSVTTGPSLAGYVPYTGATANLNLGVYSMTANRFYGLYSTVLNTYTTVNPSSNVLLMSSPNDRDAWIFLDQADTSSNWGIYHRNIDSAVSGLPGNAIGYIGGGASTLQSYINLTNGNGYFAGNLLIGTTTDVGSKLFVNGTGRFDGRVTMNLGATINTNYDIVFGNPSGNYIGQYYNGTDLLLYNGTGGANFFQLNRSSGAATFSSSVTATSFFESSSVAFKNILATNPVTSLNVDVIKYKRTNVDVDDVRYGYSAEQINSLMPELTNKEVTAVKYLDVHTLLIAELQREIKELKAKLN